jgi:glycosyltransferase involved in cell wall biosynthesis
MASSSPRISVIIPTYNRAPLIYRALDSVLRQTFSDFEIIVVDDCSQDETSYLVKKHDDPRIRLICHEKNLGAAAARNTGIEEAKGSYIAFLDSDDEWLPFKLDHQYKALKGASAPYDLSCTGFTWSLLDQNQTLTPEMTPPQDLWESLCEGCAFSPGSTLMARREVFKKIGFFDSNLARFEDWDWLLRYASKGGQMLLIPERLSHIYTRRKGVSRAISQSAQTFLTKNKDLLQAREKGPWRRFYGSVWFQVAGALRHDGQWGAMILPLLKAHIYDPCVIWRYLKQ